ncbi:hypothetical protein CAOG_03830 [Capsaspora owczarzaki ATCC 30864]|uniref:hypothetical protein n=1 Tax=Capsaspora owczarzaki (strain ATCC 30864) TaxID=595528 RepID=UPI0003521ACC|nr:hypothetical protein CAOG_03830 [Capsaspora owczarzaki ATCC 30864]|eukprot:XP_004363558.2 hypothetical protein CAOG_03830 [Capsaspora owczarzaki ATCC 30864]
MACRPLLLLAVLACIFTVPAAAQCSNTGAVANVAAIQTLLNNAAMTTICLPAQTYAFGSSGTPLTITRNVNIVGTNTIFTIGSNAARFFTISANLALVNITGLTLDATGSSYTSQGRCISVAANTRLVLGNTKFIGAASLQGALYLTSGSSAEGTGLSFSACGYSSGLFGSTSYGSAVYLEGSTTFTCTGCTFKDSVNGYNVYGGAFYLATKSYVRIYDSTFSTNAAGYAGGVADVENNSVFEVFNSNFTGNFADTDSSGGGVVYAKDGTSVWFQGCNFMSNSAKGQSGGVIFAGATANITLLQSTFTTNTASSYGAIVYTGTQPSINIIGSTFSSNSATIGGIVYTGGTASITISGSTFTSNSATSSNGGVVYTATITISGSTFTANKATSADAGVLYVGNGAGIIIDNSTFTSNTAYTDAGVIRTGTTSQVTITSSTFSQNSASGAGGVFLLEGASSAVVASDTLFYSNQAISGGVLDMISSNTLRASFFRCNFTANLLSSASGTGGTVFRVRNNQIVVVDTTLTGNVRASTTNNVGMIQVDSTGRVGVVNSQLSGNSGTKQFDALLASATLLTLGANITPSGTTMINEPNLAAYCIDCKAIAPFLCTAVPACAFVSSSRVMTPTSLLSSATPSSATPSSATPSVTPSSATPSSATPSVTPSSATPSVTPSSATPSVTPSSATPSVTPSSATPLSVTPSSDTPLVESSSAIPASVTPSSDTPSLTPSSHTPPVVESSATPLSSDTPVSSHTPVPSDTPLSSATPLSSDTPLSSATPPLSSATPDSSETSLPEASSATPSSHSVLHSQTPVSSTRVATYTGVGPNSQGASSNNTAIIGAVAAGVVLLVLLCLFLVVHRRRRQTKSKRKSPSSDIELSHQFEIHGNPLAYATHTSDAAGADGNELYNNPLFANPVYDDLSATAATKTYDELIGTESTYDTLAGASTYDSLHAPAYDKEQEALYGNVDAPAADVGQADSGQTNYASIVQRGSQQLDPVPSGSDGGSQSNSTLH